MKLKKEIVNASIVLLCIVLNSEIVFGASNKFFDFFNFPIISGGNNNAATTRSVKVFKGFRDHKDETGKINAMYMVYYHDLAVAIVRIGPKKLLLDCSIIEIYEPNDVAKAMGSLLSRTTALKISLDEMIQLMNQCSELDEMERFYPNFEEKKNSSGFDEARHLFHVVSSGIVPGTKWCGTGDVAENYSDLGDDAKTDMCCRNHDLCPEKVMAHSTKYNLENNSPYTKSHCVCDDIFYACMKRQNTRLAQILGQVYFNIIGIPCIQDGKDGKFFRKARRFHSIPFE